MFVCLPVCLCVLRRHHCPIHHFPATLGHTQRQEGVAKETDYSDTFQTPPKGARRGLKLPVVITHSELNKQPPEVVSEQGSAYQPFVDAKPAQVCHLTSHPTPPHSTTPPHSILASSLAAVLSAQGGICPVDCSAL